jgi:hypothetical protein
MLTAINGLAINMPSSSLVTSRLEALFSYATNTATIRYKRLAVRKRKHK